MEVTRQRLIVIDEDVLEAPAEEDAKEETIYLRVSKPLKDRITAKAGDQSVNAWATQCLEKCVGKPKRHAWAVPKRPPIAFFTPRRPRARGRRGVERRSGDPGLPITTNRRRVVFNHIYLENVGYKAF
jgi:hypothetical protein